MIGLCSVTFRDKKPEEVIQFAKEAGLACIEWESKQHVPVNDLKNAEKIRELTKEAGLEVSSYGTYYQVGSYEKFSGIIETAEALNTKMIRVWAGEKSSEEADASWFDTVVEDTHRIAEMAAKKGLFISFEYHSGSLTDTPESTYRLMNKIEARNVFLYWQPAETLTVKERLDSLSLLGKWITNVHVFHWEDFNHRYGLDEGKKEWEAYLSSIKKLAPNYQHSLLEFVKEDDPDQLLKDAKTLKDINK